MFTGWSVAVLTALWLAYARLFSPPCAQPREAPPVPLLEMVEM